MLMNITQTYNIINPKVSAFILWALGDPSPQTFTSFSPRTCQGLGYSTSSSVLTPRGIPAGKSISFLTGAMCAVGETLLDFPTLLTESALPLPLVFVQHF